jgi:hypothetical protein
MSRSTLVAAAYSFLLYTAAAQPAAAQAAAGDTWRVTIAPCMMGAGPSGTAAVLGPEPRGAVPARRRRTGPLAESRRQRRFPESGP